MRRWQLWTLLSELRECSPGALRECDEELSEFRHAAAIRGSVQDRDCKRIPIHARTNCPQGQCDRAGPAVACLMPERFVPWKHPSPWGYLSKGSYERGGEGVLQRATPFSIAVPSS